MRRFVSFLKTPLGNLVLFFAFVAVGGVLVYRSNARERMHSAQMTKVSSAPPTRARESITRNSLPFRPVSLQRIAAAKVMPVAAAEETSDRTPRRRNERDGKP